MFTIHLQKVMISGELSNNHRIIKLIHDFSKVESRILLSLEDHCFSMFKEKLHIKKESCRVVFRYFTCSEKEGVGNFLEFSGAINISSVTCYS